ncbi:hypothetical protein OKW21_006041 [Catalinimonas alkaloidigena]|uniref:DUF6712 family protein n=1 Tax=Catalinimonas alkaloidigena TaxID=1075417 RepID=UPI002405F851|nr:hypothetical protein [Catalinimonas alkaloidigena]MDF9800778.1 hypothetical protein [Catalinimonas alkaloidigena]
MNLITASEVKQLTTIEQNLSDDLIFPQISIAQEKHIKPILGKDLYNALIENPANYPELYEQIKTPLAFWVYYESALFLWLRMTNKGLVKRTSEYAENISGEDFKFFRSEIREYAKEFTAILIRHLEESSYELYNKKTNNSTDQVSNRDNISGIYFY